MVISTVSGASYSRGRAGLEKYHHLWTEAEDDQGNRVTPAVTYIADGAATDGQPSRRYITLLRDGAREHGLPALWVRFLDNVEPAD